MSDRARILTRLLATAAVLIGLSGCAGSVASSAPQVRLIRVQAAMRVPVWAEQDGVLLGLTETGSRVEKLDPSASHPRSTLSRAFDGVGENVATSLPGAGLAYLPQPGMDRIAVLNVSSLRQVATLRGGPQPDYLATDVGANVLLALSADHRTVTGLDPQDATVVSVQHVPPMPQAELVGPERERLIEYHVTGADGVLHYKDGTRMGTIHLPVEDAVGDQTKVTRLYVAEQGTDHLVAVDSKPSGVGLQIVGHADLGAPAQFVGVDQYRVYAVTADRLVVLETNSFEGFAHGRIPVLDSVDYRAGLPATLRDAPLSGLAVGPHRVYLTFSGQPYVLSVAKPAI